jgi:hypothetical protein
MPGTAVRRDPSTTLWAGAIVVLVVSAAVTAPLDAFTWPIRVATGLPILAFAVAAWRRGWHRPGTVSHADAGGPPSAVRRASLALWVALLGAAGGYAYTMYQSQPRDVYPTLSSLAGDAFEVTAVRGVAFALWCLLGAYVVVRR